MKDDDFRVSTARDIHYANRANRNLIEKALRLRCVSYLAQVKASLLTDTIFEIDSSKKVLSAMNSRLQREVEVRQQAQAELRRALVRSEDAVRVKDQLVAMVTHDLRGPLTAMAMGVDLLADAPELSADSREIVAELQLALQRMESLVSDILGSRHMKRGSITPERKWVEAHPHVEEVLAAHAIMARAKVVALRNDVPEGFLIHADSTLLREALANLVANAVKFSRPGGIVAVAADDPHTLVVSDQGVGMSPAVREGVLAGSAVTTVGTSGEVGTGLGLGLVREVVHAHGGRLEVQSVEGEGTRVSLVLPPAESAPSVA
jgi:signal transduction histidine kinase